MRRKGLTIIMDNKSMEMYKRRLLEEKKDVEDLLLLMKNTETIDSNSEMSNELSVYDNHPADVATELFDKERGLALKGNEMNILNKINSALKMIEEGSYGNCKKCGKEINEERLKFIPYAEYCADCQKEENYLVNGNLHTRDFAPKNRALEEFYTGFNRLGEVGFDGEDSYQGVGRYNNREKIYDEYYEDEEDGVVEPIERISNQQYKNTLY